MPEGFKGTAALADFKSVEALGDAFVNLKQHMGSSIRIPGTDAGTDQITEFRTKLAGVEGVMLKPDFSDSTQSSEFFKTLGRPDDVSGYAFDVVEGFTPNEDMMTNFKALALANNLTATQAKTMAKSMMEQDFAAQTKAQDQLGTEVAALKTEWGQAFEQNSTIAINVAKATGAPDNVIDAMTSGKMDTSFVKWMHSMAEKFGKEGQNLLNDQITKVESTPGEIKDQITEIMDNRDHPYYNANHPDHARALEKMVDLHRKLAK